MRTLGLLLLLFMIACSPAEPPRTEWEPVEGQLMTRWAANVDPAGPWPQYPRPQLKRDAWMNLNGLWEYAITELEAPEPAEYQGQILVPYPVESALSGIKSRVSPDQALWYRRNLEIPNSWEQLVKLHFEASDWHTRVWINGEFVGENKGGYHPFSFEVSSFLKSGNNQLTVKVTDPTNSGWQPVGKQVLEPGGIFYTPVTGIWQTVWMEPLNKLYINEIRLVTETNGTVKAGFDIAGEADEIILQVLLNGIPVAKGGFRPDTVAVLKLAEPELWTPETPVLYQVLVELRKGNMVVDNLESYTAFRSVGLGKDGQGFTRIVLNGEPVFLNGPLDQGFWPDGIYTPPTEEAMLYDLRVMKEVGFNMLRKHVKVESRRFYYLCDSLGLYVWQDMPNGDRKIRPEEPDIVRTEESDEQFRFELSKLVREHINHPSIIVWVPFNEGWGQYNTVGIVDLIKEIDSTRLVINTSGWSDRGVGDIHDIHNYPDPKTPQPEEARAIVLGEFGGLGYPVEGHLWVEENWGYQTFTSIEELTVRYREMYGQVFRFVDETGLSASIYTQITDVETETNGLMTYDREVIKMDPELLKKINSGDQDD